jgi:septum formation topological specificity factor MinE
MVTPDAMIGDAATSEFGRAVGRSCDVARKRDLLLQVGPLLADLLDPSVGRLVQDLLDRIRKRPFRLAVIGQMKAGKTTFVNALAGRPDLLPTDVNPWTAVATSLQFGHPSGATDGAVFRFFSAEEWAGLAEGGGLRVLQQQLLADLDADSFRRQFCLLADRARQRLGDDFTDYLDRAHYFETVTPGLVARYVAEHDDAAGVDGEPIYSDLTRSAEIFLPPHPIGVPLTVVDSPGTNDPFLVRDEITLRSLDEMDAAVVVLSARQAYSTADLALIRTMRGLRKDRLIVVINRCDELEDPKRHGEVVAEHVARLLEREFGEAVPVLTCSAAWANAAERAARGATLPIDDGLGRHLVATGLATREEVAAWQASPAMAGAGGAIEAVLAASGMPTIIDAVAHLVGESGLGHLLGQTLATLVTVAEQQEALARRDLQLLETQLKTAHSEVLAGGFEAERLEGSIQRLDGAMAKLERIAAERTAEIEATQRHGLERLRERLHEAVHRYIESERAAITFALDQQTTTKPARYDVSRLRKELEQVFLSEYRALYRHIVNIQMSASQHFRRLVNDELPSTNLDVHVNVISNSFAFPNLAALGRVSAFDVDPKLWARWRRSKKTLREAVEAFERILRTEFETVAADLARVAENEIMGSTSSLQRRLNLTIMDALHSARQRRATLLEGLADVQARQQPRMQESLLEDQLAHLAAARERLQQVDGLTRTLRAAATPEAMMPPLGASVAGWG